MALRVRPKMWWSSRQQDESTNQTDLELCRRGRARSPRMSSRLLKNSLDGKS